jgi:hypothetical protein
LNSPVAIVSVITIKAIVPLNKDLAVAGYKHTLIIELNKLKKSLYIFSSLNKPKCI